MRVLALDSALARCSAAMVVRGDVRAARQVEATQGHAALLSAIVRDVLTETATAPGSLDLVAVTVGPGSFTGIRAGLALAHGVALASGVPVIGVTVGEALADSLPHLGDRPLWVAIDSRRGRVFLERGGTITAALLDALPEPAGRIALAGDAAAAVAARLAARDFDVMLTDARLPVARHVAVVAVRRFRGELPARSSQPLYVDPPEARLPAGGPRPPPHG
ncbi:MAG TPA: tRNA (adenosine(37)-N6)-threonylcarbamoyltransferase complex dimerization subunit type 1 TsaB [Acetobacteraceae bacterium]|jgi:tRNA threonylcarbamoyladenosine biosynthesis protein TsaB